MKKRVFSWILAAVLVMGCVPARAAQVLTVRLPDYERDSFVLDETADYTLLPVEEQSGDFVGYVDPSGQLVFRVDAQDGRLYHEGFAAVKQNGLYGYLDKAGNLVIPCRYTWAGDFSGGRAVVAKADGRWAVIDQSGQELVTRDYINDFSEGYAWFRENGKYGFLNAAGEVVVSAQYDLAGDFSEGRAWVGKASGSGYRYGFIDTAGTLVIPMNYDYAGYRVFFSEGLAQVTQKVNGKLLSGYIDKSGKTVISITHTPTENEKDDRACEVSGGVAVVRDGAEYSLWNAQGTLLSALDADAVYGPQRGWITVVKGSQAGALRVEGGFLQATVPNQYTYCGDGVGDYLVVEKEGLLGVVNAAGWELVPCKYEDVVLLPGGLILVDTFGGQKQGRFSIYNSAMMPIEPTAMAYANTVAVEVDGKPVTFQMYALKNSDGYESNFVRVRDVAQTLSGTDAHFEVIWAYGSIWLYDGWTYTPVGGEMSPPPFSGDRPYTVVASQTKLNGEEANLGAILLKDDAGGGYTYIKLRDLGKALGFNVDWSAERGIYIETDKPYEEEA